MEREEAVDIEKLLEQDLDDLDLDGNDDEVQEDDQLPALLFQQHEVAEDDDFLRTVDLLKSEAEMLFSTAWTSRSDHHDENLVPEIVREEENNYYGSRAGDSDQDHIEEFDADKKIDNGSITTPS
ncbi:hypothetical protein EON65_44230, partial [archaeon]